MPEMNIRLFEGAYAGNLKTEKRTTWLAAFLILLQVGLFLYLVLTKGFAYSFLGIYLLHLLAFSFLLARVWLDYNPDYRKHLTFTAQGVSYRTGFLKKEHEFDWDEVDEVYLKRITVEFILKNEEHHIVPLDMINNDTALQQAKTDVRAIVQKRAITLNDDQS